MTLGGSVRDGDIASVVRPAAVIQSYVDREESNVASVRSGEKASVDNEDMSDTLHVHIADQPRLTPRFLKTQHLTWLELLKWD